MPRLPFLPLLASLTLLSTACVGDIGGPGPGPGVDPSGPDSGIGTDPKPESETPGPDAGTPEVQCQQPALPGNLPAIQGEPQIYNGNGDSHIFGWETSPGSGDYLVMVFNKNNYPRLNGNLQLDFSGQTARPCDTPGDGACLKLLADFNPSAGTASATYNLETGSLSLQSNSPAAPSGACRAHDNDVNGCNNAGCSYYGCNNTCQSAPPDTDAAICAAGCSAWCPINGGLQDALFTDVSDNSCSSSVNLSF